MWTSCREAKFGSERTFEAFLSDKMAVNAVLRSLEVVGEAAKNVPEEIRNRRPDVPW
jgi:uncharacterized protein with HEPN domain